MDKKNKWMLISIGFVVLVILLYVAKFLKKQ